jgi:glycosyltransferase involved in cell wall biosynthesis
MKLSIILTQYKENEDKCWYSLSSINNQQCFDFKDLEVIIVNDHSDVILSQEFLTSFKYLKDIKYIIREENAGPGVARNTGIDAATGDYVMFMDIEDILEGNLALASFDYFLTRQSGDLFVSQWINPVQLGDKYEYPIQQFAPAWVFGMFYRRAFLNLQGIRFLDYKLWNEEHYFNQKVLALTDRIVQIPKPIYVWRHPELDSITTSNGQSYSYRIMPSWVLVWDEVYSWKKSVSKLNYLEIYNTLFCSYYMMNGFTWDNPDAAAFKDCAEGYLSYFITRWEYELSKASPQEIGQLNKQASQASDKLPDEPFKEWYNRIKALGITEKPKLLLYDGDR